MCLLCACVAPGLLDVDDGTDGLEHPPSSLGPGFTDITAPVYEAGGLGLAVLESGQWDPSAGSIGDVDGDGVPDVLLTLQPEGEAGFGVFFRVSDGELVRDVSLRQGIDLNDPSFVFLGLADLDSDGLMDVLGGAINHHLIFREPDGGWTEPVHTLGPSGEWMTNPEAAEVMDLDGDGWLDLVLASDLGEASNALSANLLMSVGNRQFVSLGDRISEPTLTGPAYGFLRASLGPGDPLLQVMGTSFYDHEIADGFFVEGGVDEMGFPEFDPFDPTPLNSEFKLLEPTGFDGVEWDNAATLPTQRPMGGAVSDLDNDGDQDLMVSTTAHFSALVFENLGEWPMGDRTLQVDAQLPRNDMLMEAIPWGIAPLDLDQDGRVDFVVAHGDDATSFEGGGRNPQPTTVWWNGGDWRFEEITALTGLGRLESWRSVCVGDLELDGDADLIVGGSYSVLPRVYRNDIETGNHGFSLALRGRTSNRPGIGATVMVESDAVNTGRGFLMGDTSSPHCTQEPVIFVGLGTAEVADAVTVTWPSGYVQVVEDLEAGTQHTITEPPLIKLFPKERRGRADGQSRIVVEVRPHDPYGEQISADVRVEIVHGTGTFEGEVERDGHVYRRTLVAPTEPGFGVVSVTLDGVEMGVRPRVWWD